MPRQAQYLYKAKTGSFPTSGASLKTALGAVSGDHTSYWNIYDFTSLTGDVPNDGVQVADGYIWSFSGSWSKGSKAGDIMRTGAVLALELTSSLDGQEVSFNTTNSVTTSGFSADVQVRGKLVDTDRSYNVWFDGYTFPSEPPDDSMAKDVRFVVATTRHGAGSGGYDTLTFNLKYTPDVGPYNPDLSHAFTTSVHDRIEEPSDYQHIEWHGNSSYTDLLQDGDGYVVSCPYGGSVTVYLRLWRDVWNAWVNVGACTFTDPRGGL